MNVSLKVWTQVATGLSVGIIGSAVGLWVAQGVVNIGVLQLAFGVVVAAAMAGPTWWRELQEERAAKAATARQAAKVGSGTRSKPAAGGRGTGPKGSGGKSGSASKRSGARAKGHR